jgi:hypothetical protein
VSKESKAGKENNSSISSSVCKSNEVVYAMGHGLHWLVLVITQKAMGQGR